MTYMKKAHLQRASSEYRVIFYPSTYGWYFFNLRRFSSSFLRRDSVSDMINEHQPNERFDWIRIAGVRKSSCSILCTVLRSYSEYNSIEG